MSLCGGRCFHLGGRLSGGGAGRGATTNRLHGLTPEVGATTGDAEGHGLRCRGQSAAVVAAEGVTLGEDGVEFLDATPALGGALDATAEDDLAGRLLPDGFLCVRVVEALGLRLAAAPGLVLVLELQAVEAGGVGAAHALLLHLNTTEGRVLKEEGLGAAAAMSGHAQLLRIGNFDL